MYDLLKFYVVEVTGDCIPVTLKRDFDNKPRDEDVLKCLEKADESYSDSIEAKVVIKYRLVNKEVKS